MEVRKRTICLAIFCGDIHFRPYIAMENPNHKWRFVAAKIIYFYGQFSMAMLNNQRV